MLGSKGKKQAKIKKKDTKQMPEPQKVTSVKYIFVIATCALLFFPAFFRGLFFERELRIVHIATFIVMLIWLVLSYKGKGFPVLRYKYEYLLFAAVAMYFLTVPLAASRRLALLEALKYVNYLAVYILVRDHVIADKRAVKMFMNTILASVFCMSVIGLMNYMGLIETHGALTGGRVSSTLQYPNTLAAVIGATVFLNLYLAAETEKTGLKAVYNTVLNILLVTFVLTFSRTMYIMFPLLMIAFMVFVPAKQRGSLLSMIITAAVPSLAAAVLLMKYSDTNSSVSMVILLVSALVCVVLLHLAQRFNRFFALTKLLKYIVVGMLLAAVVTGTVLLSATRPLELSHYNTEDGNISRSKTVYSVEGEGDYLLVLDAAAKQSEEKSWIGRVAINSIDKTYNSGRIKNYYIREEVGGPVEIPFSTDPDTYYVTIGFYNYYNDTSFIINKAEIINRADGKSLGALKLDYKYLPQNFASRIESLNIKAKSFQARIAFFRDALSIIKDSPLIGLGGGAWQAAYMKYRSYEYWTTQAHSYPIQVWMEIGTIGFLLVLGFTVLYSAGIIQSYRNTDTEKEKLQLAAIAAFILCVLLHSLVDFDLSLGAVSIMLWASFALAAVHFTGEEKVSYKTGAYIKPVFVTAVAILLCVTTCTWAAEQFNIQTAEAFSNKEYEKALKSAKTAAKLDPFNPSHRINLVNVIGETDTDMAEKYMLVNEQLEAAIRHSSFDSRMYGQMALHRFYHGRFDDAIGYLDTAISYNPTMPEPYASKMDFMYNMAKYYHGHRDETEAAEVLDGLMNIKHEIADKNRELIIPIETDPRLLSYYYKANFALDYIDERDIFDEADKIVMYEHFTFDTDGDMLPDMWQIPYQDDKEIKGRIGEGDGVFTITSDSPSFYIQRTNLGLQPSSEYILIIDGYSRSPEGKLRVMVRSGSGESEQFRDGYFAFDEDSRVYQTKFWTTDDIIEGDQYIRLNFNDMDDEVVLKKIIIIKND